MLGDAGEACVFFYDALHTAGGNTAVITRCIDSLGITGIIKKKCRERIGTGIEIILYSICCGLTDEDGAIFAAFATNHKFATLKIDGAAV